MGSMIRCSVVFVGERPGDVKKEKTLQPGHSGWAAKAAYLEAMSGDSVEVMCMEKAL